MAANDSAPQTIVEAARIASRAALSNTNRLIPYSKIPLIIHQTSRYSLMNTWNPKVLPWVEQWVQHSVSPTDGKQMAYFFWDDEGILELVRDFEKDLLDDLLEVFTPVERADIFRILACKWFGGVVSPVSNSLILIDSGVDITYLVCRCGHRTAPSPHELDWGVGYCALDRRQD